MPSKNSSDLKQAPPKCKCGALLLHQCGWSSVFVIWYSQLIDMILAERGFCNGVADESSLLGHYTEPGTVYRMIRCFSCDFNEAHRSVASTNTACRPESLPIMYNDGTRFVKVLKFEMCLPCFSILFHCLWRLVVNKHINLSRIGYICSLPRNNVLAKHTRYNNTSHISFVCPSDD